MSSLNRVQSLEAFNNTKSWSRERALKAVYDYAKEADKLEADKAALLSATIKQLIKDYNELEEFESPHVIFQMANDVDRLEARCKELEAAIKKWADNPITKNEFALKDLTQQD